MDRVRIEIQNCYGINRLESILDFGETKSTYAIYAPNGAMKTSFANVFDDYGKDLPSKDLIYPERDSVRNITNMDGEPLKRESIFVIKPFDRDYNSDKMSTLLVNEKLQMLYDNILKTINNKKDALLKELKAASGLKVDNIENEISKSFTGDNDTFFLALERIKNEVLSDDEPHFSHILYTSIFDDKIIAFLETGDFKKQIQQYIEKYEDLVSKSKFLRKGFNHYNASTIHKNLKDNGFFKAEHSVNLNYNGSKREILDEKEFLKVIQEEKDNILNDKELKKIFESIDSKISNAQLRDFREFLFSHKEILPELANIYSLKQKLWISYMKDNKLVYQNLLEEYLAGQKEINNIIDKAKQEKTSWEKVVDIFNKRFYVPFKLVVKNKEDMILKRNQIPSIYYYYEDRKASVDNDLLYTVLSQGERRALYLLKVIFEIESRKQQNMETLFVIDDIADSFDYKNKYAIIEYLKDISECGIFYSIILTHNFDFFRTIQDRIGMNKWEGSYVALREKEKISLERVQYTYISNPFKNWKKELSNNSKLIASIAFARNIVEYIGDEENMEKLTSLLHIKPLSNDITIADLENIYKNIFKDLNDLVLFDHDKQIFQLIYENADVLMGNEAETGLNLENKIVMSIAIRLLAEKFMINKISSVEPEPFEGFNGNQTGRLFGKYKKLFSGDAMNIEILERVILMTPENIHLNSFMYEPIIDISDYHLKKLYKDVKESLS
jgi:hypothetical protein